MLLLLLLILSSCFSIGISVYGLMEQYHAIIVPSCHCVIVVNFVVMNDDVCFVVMNDVNEIKVNEDK